MPCFWSRKKERERALSTLTASRAMDLGIFFQVYQPRLCLDDVKPWQTEVADPEFSTLFQKQRPGKRCGLSRILPWKWLGKAGSRDSHGFGSRDSHGFGSRDSHGFGSRDSHGFGSRDSHGFGSRDSHGFRSRDSHGFGSRDSHGFGSRDSHGFGSRASKMQAEVGDVLGCAWEEVEALETCQNSRGGEAHQEKLNTHSVIQPPKEEGWDVPRSARMEEKALGGVEKPGSCRNSGAGKAHQEKVNTHSEIQPPKEEGWDEPTEGCKVWDGDVPGKGNGLGMDQSQPLVQAGASEDEEGRTSNSPETLEWHGEDKDDPTIPGKDGDWEDSEPPSAEGMSGEEQRSQAWEKLGEDMERWEGEPVPAPSVAVSGGKRCFLGMLGVCGSGQDPQGSQQDQGDDIPIDIRAMIVAGSKGQWREEFPAVWAGRGMDCGKVEEEEELLGRPVPFQREQPLAPTVASRVQRILREFLNKGIVVKGESACNNTLIPKWKGTTLLLTLDCRALNKATPMEAPESVSITKTLASIPASSRCFSVLCLYNSSFAIPLARSCWHRFAFTFRHQQFLFTRLPPGFGSTNSILHRRVAGMLFRLEQGQEPWAVNYYGVILVTGRNPEETAARTRRVLELIQQTGFKAKLEKAQLVQTQVKYLGMTISGKGREVPDEKVDELCEEPDPEDVHELRSLLGKFGYWQDYIPDYWELALPLHHLTLPGVPWKWQWRQKQQLRELKDALEGKSVLRFPDKSRPFFIRINIHGQTVGSTLLQDEGGSLVPVQRFSRMLKDLKRSSLVEQSCVVALWAIQAFKPFLGSSPVVLQLPHSPGMFVFRGPALASSGVRPPATWALLLLSEEGPESSGNTWWEPSKYERQEIVCQCHGGHRGVEETLARVREVGAWEGARQDVERWVRNCPGCGKGGTEPQRAEGPWSCLSISITGTLPKTTEGFCALLVVQDEFSGWVEAFPLRLEQGREEQELIQLLLREVFGRLGRVGTVRVPEEPRWLWHSMRMSPLREYWVTLEHFGDSLEDSGDTQEESEDTQEESEDTQEDSWDSLENSEDPLEDSGDTLEDSGDTLEHFWKSFITSCLFRVARKAKKEWLEMLPLILAGIRSIRPDRAKLMPLLSIPGLPLEMVWEEQEGLPRGNELSWLGRMRVLPGYRERVGAAIRGQPRTEMG